MQWKGASGVADTLTFIRSTRGKKPGHRPGILFASIRSPGQYSKGNVQEIQATKLKQFFTHLPKMRQSTISVKKPNMQKNDICYGPRNWCYNDKMSVLMS